MPSQNRFVRPQQRAIFIGDSLAARAFAPGGQASMVPGVGFVVSGGPADPIAAIETTTPHGLIPGNYVQIFNVGDVRYLDALNGAVLPLRSIPSGMQLTVNATFSPSEMANGDYSAGYLDNPWQVRALNELLDMSWLAWLNVYMKGYFTVVANYAQGGTGSQVGVELLPKIKAGPKAEYAFIQYCTNDLNSAMPDVADCLANVNTIVAAVIATGMVPVVCMPLAIGDALAASGDPASAAKASALRAVQAAFLQMAANDPRVLVLDTYGASVDPADALGRYKPGYAPVDGLHPSSFGAASIARAIATDLIQYLPPTDTLPTSTSDDATIDPGASNIVQNGLMTGGGGDVSGSGFNQLSGTAPTGWGVGASGGSAVHPLTMTVSGNNVHTGFPGYSLDLSIRAAISGQQFQIGTNGSGGSSMGSRMQADQWYRCGFQASSNPATNELNLSGQVVMNFGSGDSPSVYFMASQGTLWENGMPMRAGEALTFESQPFFVPAVPVAGAWLFINGLFTGSVNDQTVSIGRAFCRIVPNPYQ